MDVIDLRSDTVTVPTEEMRQAMATAVVGDDVYGEDPTLNQLEHDAAEMFGKEAAVFVTSGSQGNLVALLAHCERGSEIVVGDKAHTFVFEAGGMSALGGIMPHTVPVLDDGSMALDAIKNAIRVDNEHFPRTRLITVENTQGTVGGMPLDANYMNAVADIAHSKNLKFHVDGARIFNAATACGISVRELTESADSVTFCLSKGLCAPVGSILVGSKDFIKEARRARKMLGGAMRQTGILAAAGSIALHKMSTRLQEDHDNAAYLAEGMSDIPGIRMMSQATNFVFFWLEEDAKLSPKEFSAAMKQHNILVNPYTGFERKFRCVTHYYITRERIDTVVQAMRTVLQ